MTARKDITGQRFGRLVVIAFVDVATNKQSRWLCECDCGTRKVIRSTSLMKGNTSSCGCLREELRGKPSVTHGQSRTETYNIWSGMLSRCFNQNATKYPDYGGRGITVCDRWRKFENFLEDMGERPEGKSLDRYPDNDGDYEPGNCRWASLLQQANNKRSNIILTNDGKTMTLGQWSRHLGIPMKLLRSRYYKGIRPPNLFRSLTDQRLMLTFDGQTKTLREWAQVAGLSFTAFRTRYYTGERPPELFRPAGERHVRNHHRP